MYSSALSLDRIVMPLEVGNGDCGDGDEGTISVDDDGREPLATGATAVGRRRVNAIIADDVVRSILRERDRYRTIDDEIADGNGDKYYF